MKAKILIIGGGASGLSLAKLLVDQGEDFIVLTEPRDRFNANHSLSSVGRSKRSTVRTVHECAGGTKYWGGGLVEMNHQDFEHEHSFGSEKIFENIAPYYNDAWAFFDINREKILIKDGYDSLVIQDKALDFSDVVPSDRIIEGRIRSVNLEGKQIKSVSFLDQYSEVKEIQTEKLVISAGTIGTILLLYRYKILSRSVLDSMSTGIYTHPKLSLKSAINETQQTPSLISVAKHKLFFQKILMKSGERSHSLRFEPRALSVLDRVDNALSTLKLGTTIITLLNIVAKYCYLFILRTTFLQRFGVLKVYLDTPKPNYKYSYDKKTQSILLDFIPSSIELSELRDDLVHLLPDLSGVTIDKVTTVHTHFLGGLKLSSDREKFVDSGGKLVAFNNVWLNSGAILNGKGYANPILTLVALSHVVNKQLVS